MITRLGEWEPSEIGKIKYVKNISDFTPIEDVMLDIPSLEIIRNDRYLAWYRAYKSIQNYINILIHCPEYLDDDLWRNQYDMARIILYSEYYESHKISNHPSSILTIFNDYFKIRHAEYNLIALCNAMKYYVEVESNPIAKELGSACYKMVEDYCDKNIDDTIKSEMRYKK